MFSLKKITLVILSLIFLLTNVLLAKEDKYHRKAITAVNTVARTTSAIHLTPNQAQTLENAFEEQIIMPRFDKVALPANVSQQLQRRISAKPLNESELEKAINEIVVPPMIQSLQATAMARAQMDDPHWDRHNFIQTKAKELGLTAEDLERMMECAYIYVPFVSNLTITDKKNNAEASIAGGIFWYYLSPTPGKESVKLIKKIKSSAKASSTSRVDQIQDVIKGFKTITSKSKNTSSQLPPRQAAFKNAARLLATNLSVESRRQIPELSLGAPIASIQGNKAYFHLGKKEGLIVDDRYELIDQWEDQQGKVHEEKVGHLMVTAVKDNRKNSAFKSKGKVIIGGGNMAEGMGLSEVPTMGIDFSFRLGWADFNFESFDIGYMSLEEKSEYGISLADAALQFNLGRKLGISQFFVTAGINYGYMPLQVNTLNDEKINQGHLFGWKVGLMKRFYLGRLAFMLGGDYGASNFWLQKKVDDTSLKLSHDFRTGTVYTGIDFALGTTTNFGIIAGYRVYDEAKDWKFKMNDEEVPWFSGDGIKLDRGEYFGSIVISHALPSFFWTPF